MKRVRPALGHEHEQAYYRRVGVQMREIRERLGMERSEFGKAIGVSRWTVISYEEGSRPKGHFAPIPLHVMARACDLGGVSLTRFRG
jgi:DNA-binding XRE family transcriptional regulator